jgi:ATP-binding cassette, subfamily G (WHITE), eye pigment precursor transporter
MFLNFQATVVVFQQEKPVYVRERDAGMYDIWVYTTTKLIAEQPIMLLLPLIMNLMVYFFIGFTDSFTGFMGFYLVLMMMIQVATSLGYVLSAFFDSESAAAAFAPAINAPINLLAGYMVNLKGIWG